MQQVRPDQGFIDAVDLWGRLADLQGFASVTLTAIIWRLRQQAGVSWSTCRARQDERTVVDERTLATAIDILPSELVVWHDGPAALARLLATCTLNRLLGEADLLRVGVSSGMSTPIRDIEDPQRTEHRDRWRHAVSSVIEWHSRHGTPEASLVDPPARGPSSRNRTASRRARRARPRQVGLRDYEAAVHLASAWCELDPIRVGLRTGDMEVVRRDGRHVWVRNRRRAEIEVLDIVLGLVTVGDRPETPPASPDTITEWFRYRSRVNAHAGSLPERHPAALSMLNSFPSGLRARAWSDIENGLRRQGTTVADDLDLGGLTFGDARTCYAFLISQLQLNELAAFHFGAPETMLWGIKPASLVTALAVRVDRTSARAFVQMCSFSSGRSPVSAPLIPSGDLLLVPAEIVAPIAFERTLLRAASADPGAAGALGNVLGRRAARWAERLRTIPDCHVAHEVRVKDAAGRSLGDLDVVGWDPQRRVMAVFETKWPVDAATLNESNKVDAMFDKGTAQLTRLRSAIDDGSATVLWPSAWDIADDVTTSWWVGSAQQLDSRPARIDDCINTTSLRMVEQLLPASDLSDLLLRLTAFPLPRPGHEYDLEPRTVPAGPLTIHYDALALHGTPPVPPPDRRIHNAWT